MSSYDAKIIGAVNTIHFTKQKLIGHNTDHIGFRKSLYPLLKRKRKALILGDGGAAKAIKYALNTLGIEHKTVSRKSSFDYSDITSNDIEYYNIIINTTPLGSLPYINETPNIPYQSINSSHLLYDLNYNPVETKFLSYGKNRNIQKI